MILIPALFLAIATKQGGTADAVSLGRVFKANTKLAYAMRSSLHSESRAYPLQTWIPSDLDINYDFSEVVQAMKTDGIAQMRYRRPTIYEVHGETFNEPEKTDTVKANMDYQLTVSPFNEILEVKDLSPKKPAKNLSLIPALQPAARQEGDFIGPFLQELFRLALFAGSMDSALDFAPKTPFNPVKVGDTWKRTVGYQPQKLKGKEGKQAVQRLDYTYTYKGLVDGEKGKVYRVEAALDFTTDLADFIHQITESTSEETGLSKFPLVFKATILFDLDRVTKDTIKAEANSEASFQVLLPNKTQALLEEKMKGHTTLRLVGRAAVPPAK